MEPVLLYSVPQGCSFGSIVALEWLRQPYRLCRINMPQEMQTDRYARINPIRETPALLLENGHVLAESAAIMQNVAVRGHDLDLGFAQGALEFDRLNQRLAFLNTTFFSAFSPLTAGNGARRSGSADGQAAHGRGHLLCGPRALGELPSPIKQNDCPRVLRLCEKLEADPAVAFAHAIEEQRPAKSAGRLRGHVTLEELQARLTTTGTNTWGVCICCSQHVSH